jgi:hypothetical protein
MSMTTVANPRNARTAPQAATTTTTTTNHTMANNPYPLTSDPPYGRRGARPLPRHARCGGRLFSPGGQADPDASYQRNSSMSGPSELARNGKQCRLLSRACRALGVSCRATTAETPPQVERRASAGEPVAGMRRERPSRPLQPTWPPSGRNAEAIPSMPCSHQSTGRPGDGASRFRGGRHLAQSRRQARAGLRFRSACRSPCPTRPMSRSRPVRPGNRGGT